MRVVQTVRSRSITAASRLDAAYFTSPGAKAQELVLLAEAAGLEVVELRDIASVSAPARFKRQWAARSEESVPYLRPYDIFEYVPSPAGWLSVPRSPNLAELRVQPGTILQTCSGRNLGPSVLVDDELAEFALSHDLVRIRVESEPQRMYVHAFLLSSIGQALLRQGKSGSVIDHLTADHVGAISMPLLGHEAVREVSQAMSAQTLKFADARAALCGAHRLLADQYPREDWNSPNSEGWTTHSSVLSPRRLDAAFHHPAVRDVRGRLLEEGGVRLGEIAEVWLPPRYKRYYVSPPQGRPILSGRQILQYRAINLRHVSDRSFTDPASMEVREGMTLFGGVGRAEGRLGSAGLVGADRDGWLASNDVMRLVPRPGVSPGAIYAAFAVPAVQQQVEALPYGSVIDHLYPEDIGDVIVPAIDESVAASVTAASADAASAISGIEQIVRTLEERIRSSA